MSQDESITMFRDSAADYIGATDQRQRVRALEDAGGGFDRKAWSQIAELGWLSILVPEEAGGLGLGVAEMAAIAQEAGRQLLPEPFVDAGVHPLALLSRLPSGGLRDRLLERMQSGEVVAGVAWQESAGELEVGAGQTGARVAGEEVLIDGFKRFVRPGTGADGWIVCATADGSPVLAWVPADAPGITVSDEFGVDGGIVATLGFDGATGQLLAQGDVADTALRCANEIARIGQAAELAGIARQALQLTREYLVTRVQFGRPIGSFQALQHRMVDAMIQVELAEACLREGLAFATGDDLAAIASRMKARCAHAAVEVTRMAIQLHGAIGTTNEFDIGLYFKRAMTLASRLGNAVSHRRRHADLAQLSRRPAAPASEGEYREFPSDADWEAMPEPEFRRMVRAFFATHYPQERRYMPYRQTWAESREWYMTLSRLGWIAPAWPREHGGMGLPADKLIAYIEESEAWGVARPPDQGLVMVGPILMRFGTDEQRARFLPKILAGDHFIVNGQKTWTTWGADGTHMFMLVRTDKTVKKQAGISFLLVDLKTQGITVRPIRNIAGELEFCEVFFDDVEVPRETELAKRGAPIPPSISMLKIWSTETYERLALLLIESAHEYGGLRDHCKTDEIDLHVVAPLFNAIGAKIFAGSNEIQRNILAKAVLELPT